MALEPTHHATHPIYKQVDLYVPPSLLEKLESPDAGVRHGAQDSIAIAFREESRITHGTHIGFVERGTIELYEHENEPIQMGPGGDPLDEDDEENGVFPELYSEGE